MSKLTHLNHAGEAHMVDVGDKQHTSRIAIAQGIVKMNPETLALALEGNNKKGDVLGTARLAGIMGAKKTADLIPLCHPLALTKVSIEIEEAKGISALKVTALAKVHGQTGVEMEALTACSISCLTIYDMLKAADREMVICDICLLEKQGGKSGNWQKANA